MQPQCYFDVHSSQCFVQGIPFRMKFWMKSEQISIFISLKNEIHFSLWIKTFMLRNRSKTYDKNSKTWTRRRKNKIIEHTYLPGTLKNSIEYLLKKYWSSSWYAHTLYHPYWIVCNKQSSIRSIGMERDFHFFSFFDSLLHICLLIRLFSNLFLFISFILD